MELAIEFAVGVSYLVIGLSCFLHTQVWLEWMESIRKKGRQKSIVLGMVGLMLSSFIVGFHPVWSGLPALVTILGVMGMLEGSLYLLFPNALLSVVRFFAPARASLFRGISLVIVLLSILILYGWWQQVGY